MTGGEVCAGNSLGSRGCSKTTAGNPPLAAGALPTTLASPGEAVGVAAAAGVCSAFEGTGFGALQARTTSAVALTADRVRNRRMGRIVRESGPGCRLR